jgi:uracil-DNA glycosylase
MDRGVLLERVAPDWLEALGSVSAQVAEMAEFLSGERRAGRDYLPQGSEVMRAFEKPLADVRVLIVVQDPYPTPGHAVGLAFSVDRDVRPVPRSLQNIYRELETDLDIPPARHGDLSSWSDEGVMLLNRALTVRSGAIGSHRGRGWEPITDAAIGALVARGGPLVVILWGRDARSLTPLLGNTAVIASAHPSPLSARRGFFGSKPFSRANESLLAQGAAPIDWSLDG